MTARTIFYGVFLGLIIYLVYDYIYTNNTEFFNDSNSSSSNLQFFIPKSNQKKVSFSDDIKINTINNYNDNVTYNDKLDHVINDKQLDSIVDNLLNKNIDNYDKKMELIAETNQDLMFLELEKDINKIYNDTNSTNDIDNMLFFRSVERPDMPNLLPNSDTVKNSNINPVLNTDCYNQSEPSNKTLWQAYDDMTTNNYKQYNNLDKVEPLDISNGFFLGSTNNGSTFDNYSKSKL